MDPAFSAYLAALALGAVHAIEVDHMVVVSVFAGFKPRFRAAAGYGARWGIGHGLVVMLVGTLLAWSGIRLPDAATGWGQILVGISLVALGIWALRRTWQFHTHKPDTHDHSHGHLHAHSLNTGVHSGKSHNHSHRHDPARHHQHLPTTLGALHGLAGSAPVLALIPITLLENLHQAIVYLLLFSVATTLSMTMYGLLAAAAIQGIGLTQRRIKLLTTLIASATIVVGGVWVGGALVQ